MKHFTLLVATLMLGIGTASYAATNGGGGGGTDCGCKDEDNPIKNGSFEQGTDFWHTTDGLDFKAEELYNVCGDNNGLLFGHGEIWQDVEVGPDHKVSVSVYGGTHDTHPVHKFKLVFLDENDQVIEGSGTEVNMDYAVGSNSELKQYFLDAITTEAVKKVRFIAYSEGGYFKVDVVCMTITPSMPVTLSAFNVTKEGSLATLKWSTATESNASHFDVQHSTDGKTWALLTSIEAKGESSTLQNYTYTHTAPSARNLYRLKMVDADETFAYSSIRNLNFGDVEMEIYPNPSSDRIRFSSARPVDNVKIFNTNGVMVMNAKPDASNEVDVRAIAQGIYFVKVNDGEMAKRIVVAR